MQFIVCIVVAGSQNNVIMLVQYENIHKILFKVYFYFEMLCCAALVTVIKLLTFVYLI